MVFICGLINIFITVTNIRKMIIRAIPESLQHAIGGGIGISLRMSESKMQDSYLFQQTSQLFRALSLKAEKRQMLR